ncbi:lipase [Alicyclobacillus sacchari]|uniref:SGNH/GDSL hydrolase family protein n=1 Tax=Alicyclobacillus sacchari TaxID=392010 RepID=UPI0023E95FB8|nr:SGNH/GDSL hydrolase family protein [Alicyclobacillus sacchari]GMA58402.1 lipase [Alicyclobacillus sacchari]
MTILGPIAIASVAMLTLPAPIHVSLQASHAATAVHTMAHSQTANRSAGSLVALGDSITFGFNLGDNRAPSKLAFPYLIGAKEHDSVMDLGVPGWTSSNLLHALQSDPSMRSDVAKATIVTIDIGSNDLLQPTLALLPAGATNWNDIALTADQSAQLATRLSTGVENIATNVASILHDVHALNPKATVVVYDLYNPLPASDRSLYMAAQAAVGAANVQIAKDAVAYGDAIADAFDAFAGHSNYILKNDVHPTAAGQAALAKQGRRPSRCRPRFGPSLRLTVGTR